MSSNGKKTSGILRIDTHEKPRRLSGSSVEFKLQPELLGYEPTSPASSNYAIIASPQLSVRFANQTDQDTSDNSRVEQLSEDQSTCLSPIAKDNTRENFPLLTQSQLNSDLKKFKSPFLSAKRKKPRKNLRLSLEASDDYFYRCDKESPIYMEPVSPLNLPELNSDEDDYSVSVSAIMQRRLSTKRGSRKGKHSVSSPLDMLEIKDRRRSSVYTTSSGETAITMEETNNQDSTQEQIFENIRIHKEVLQQVKWQPWTMKRKLKLVQQAKSYIAQHEGELQERFASSRSYRDIWQRFKIVVGAFFSQKWQHTKRELANLAQWLIPWELRIKEIESHFGSVVASYFTFLRWLFWVNIVIAAVLIVFVAVPELIMLDTNAKDERKLMSNEEQAVAQKLITIWEFEGFLKYSPLFYGFYTKERYKGIMWWYDLPLAYFLTGVAVYIYSFYATLQKMAENSRMSKLSSKDDDCTFSWKIFTGWDFMIGHTETAQNRLSSIILGFKEALLEESEKKKDSKNWKIISLRIFVNLMVLLLLCISAAAVIWVVGLDKGEDKNQSWLERNALTLMLSAISFFFPMIFESLGLLEYYHPRQQLRVQLGRIMVLNLLNMYSMIYALFGKIDDMTEESANLRKIIHPPITNGFDMATTTGITEISSLMTTITPELTIGTITTISAILSSIMTKPNDSFGTTKTTTAMDFDTSTFYDGAATVSPFEMKFDENRNIKMTTDEQNILTTFSYNDEEPTTQESVDIEYDPSVAHYYLMSDEELEQEKKSKVRSKRLVVSDWNSTLETDFDGYSTNFDDYDNRNLTEYPITNDTDNWNITTLPTTTEYQMDTTTEDDFTTITAIKPKTTIKTTTKEITTMLPTTNAVMIPVVDKYANMTQDNAQNKIRKLCWETKLGQELVKLTVMDLIISVGSTMFFDFFRALFVRYMNGCWCMDLEKQWPQYADFKIAENILHLVNNQGMVWMGMFFSPGLALINLVKLGILMYLRSWTVLTCNVPHEVVFRASRSNNFYLALLLTMLFLCVLPVSYAIVLLTPSWHCGPFSEHDKIYYLFTNATMHVIPDFLHSSIHYLASPAAIIPLLVLLVLIIYYMVSLTGSLREANHDLRNQLRKERTEERKKMWKLAEAQTKGPENGANTLTSRWKKVLEGAQSPSPENAMAGAVPDTKIETRKELLAKIMKKALRKGSASDDDSQVTNVGDETDTEAHESLPRDHSPITKTPDVKSKRKLKNPFAQIIAMAKEKATKENGVENQENQENIRKEIDTHQEQLDQKKSLEEQEADEKERIVSERRRSLFKRQENIGATAVDVEREVSSDKKPKAPDLIFKFDQSLKQSTVEKQSDESKKPKPEKPKRNGANVKYRCSPHHEVTSDSSSDYPATTMGESKDKSETPHYAAPMKIRPVTEKPVSPGPEGKYSKKREDEKVDEEETKQSPSKPKRKFNKFFALDKDNKTESSGPKSPKSPIEPIPENPALENIQKQSSLSSKDSIESSSKDSKTDKKPAKRQDSQTSIWSDNIPVITISKTESKENILEEGSGTIKKKKKTPKKSEQ